MQAREDVTVLPVTDAPGRAATLEVLRSTYLTEKGWVADPAEVFPAVEIERENVLWLTAFADGRPVGTLRVGFDPPIEGYARYKLEFLDPRLDVAAFLRRNRIAEIGRFAVVADARGNIMIPASLMRAAVKTTLTRGYTHFVTDVLEDDPHSPLGFHTRVLGFQKIATHRTGELLSDSRRITLVLDIMAAYLRLRDRKSWIFRYLASGWEDWLRQQADRLPSPPN
jgi:hypothetical protein